MDTVTYIMVMMASNEGIQEAVPLTVHSCPIFIQVNVSRRLHFHKKKKCKADNTEPFCKFTELVRSTNLTTILENENESDAE
jgi:hypothetical protein